MYESTAIWDGFSVKLIFAKCSANLTERMDPWSVNVMWNAFKYKGTSFLNKNFEELTSLSTVLCLCIDNISSKHDHRSTASSAN